jgi:hypothetical protein
MGTDLDKKMIAFLHEQKIVSTFFAIPFFNINKKIKFFGYNALNMKICKTKYSSIDIIQHSLPTPTCNHPFTTQRYAYQFL